MSITNPHIEPFFHKQTGTWTYVVHDGDVAVLIDPVLDYDHKSGAVSTESIQAIRDYLTTHGLKLARILETHAHADHLTAAHFIRTETGVPVGIGAGIRKVQAHFAPIFELEADSPELMNAFEETYTDGEIVRAGDMAFEVMATPGHTSDSLSYRIGDDVFVGDTIFAPDIGTARCDFPGGSVQQLYDSIQRFYAMPDDTRLRLCHDYPPAGRDERSCVTVGESKRDNKMLSGSDTADSFANKRHSRDAELPAPNLLYPSLQVNIRGGALPARRTNGQRYLATPLKASF